MAPRANWKGFLRLSLVSCPDSGCSCGRWQRMAPANPSRNWGRTSFSR